MTTMTRERWLQIEKLQWEKILKDNPTANRRRLQKQLRKAMIATHGPLPPEEAKPPVKVRIGLWWIRKKLKGMTPTEVPMFLKKLIVSLMFGVGAAAAAVQLALADSAISGDEWGLILSAFFAAAYGKFSSNTTVIAPSRTGESMTSGPK